MPTKSQSRQHSKNGNYYKSRSNAVELRKIREEKVRKQKRGKPPTSSAQEIQQRRIKNRKLRHNNPDRGDFFNFPRTEAHIARIARRKVRRSKRPVSEAASLS